jgi:type I restriction enzyme S subunit
MRDKPDAFDGTTPWVRIEDFDGKFIEDSKSGQRVSPETIRKFGLKVFPAGTVLCSCSCSMGATAIVRRPLVSNQTFIGVVPKPSLSSDYLFYLLQVAREHLTSIATGAIQQYLSRRDFSTLRIPVPPVSEQCAIADFLDRKTAAIDSLVERKRRAALLLAERRQALIRQAVTKGLDPCVPMADSGVIPLGEVPKHWKVVTVRRIAHVGQGDAFAHDIQGQEAGDLPWFKIADMNRPGNEIDMLSAGNFVDRRIAAEHGATVFPAGAVIFPRVGAALLTNKRRVLSRPSIVDDNTYALVPKGDVRSRFLFLSLLLVDMASIASAGLVPTVTFGAIKDLQVALPPLSEQDLIVQYVESECATLDALAALTTLSVEKLLEYRQALITAAVTGQFDLNREAA